MSDALAFEGVVKRYRRVRALDGLDARFPAGAICGLVGPNGAGKTTAFSLVGGTLRADAGAVSILGERGFDPWRLKGRLGVLPQDAELGPRHTSRELLVHLGRLQGLSRVVADRAAADALDEVRLGARADHRIGTLSHGMRRRVAVATALLGEPELVLLDEPTAGLDPVQARSLRAVLAARRGRQTLVVSSHNLDELERLCDWVVFLDHGRCTRQGTIQEVTDRTSVVEWELGEGAVPVEVLEGVLPDHAFVLSSGVLVQRAPLGSDLDASSVVVAGALAAAGVPIRGVRRGVSLERQLLDGMGSDPPPPPPRRSPAPER